MVPDDYVFEDIRDYNARMIAEAVLVPGDVCAHCRIPDRPGYGDPEMENTFTCADCACAGCEFQTACTGQCGEGR